MVEKRTYSCAEASEALGVSKNTFKRLLESGEIEFVRAGRRYLIPIANVERFLAGTTQSEV